jgi:hypothetical protein
MEEDQMQTEQDWKPTTSDKWDKIASGKWIPWQKAAWNRMALRLSRWS